MFFFVTAILVITITEQMDAISKITFFWSVLSKTVKREGKSNPEIILCYVKTTYYNNTYSVNIIKQIDSLTRKIGTF